MIRWRVRLAATIATIAVVAVRGLFHTIVAADIESNQIETSTHNNYHEENEKAASQECMSSVGVNTKSTTSTSSRASITGWNPKADHPCTIQRLSMKKFYQQFQQDGGLLPPLYEKPIVITTNPKTTKHDEFERQHFKRNEYFRNLTRSDTILKQFPNNFTVTLSSSNQFSEHRRIVSLREYIEDTIQSSPQSITKKANETWYLFGETYSEEWKTLLANYILPPCQACADESLVALAFGIGNSGSGVQWHIHGPGFSESIRGRKHWILSKTKHRQIHKDETSYHWMYYHYGDELISNSLSSLVECTLYPGDILYFPDMWWHATINIDDYTAFISTFVQEHLFVKQKNEMNAMF